MKALGYFKAHDLSEFSIRELDVPDPELKPTDLLVRVKAISVNPVDFKIRSSRNGQQDKPVILGWDAAGIIEKCGSEVTIFKPGDEVYYAGDNTKDGAYAELQSIDHRVVAKKPKNLSFSEAAALPLTTLTAWESLFEQLKIPAEKSEVFIMAGAGGVGSIAIQLLKALTKAHVITTASRPDTVAWTKKMGADLVIDYHDDIPAALQKNNIQSVDAIFSATTTQDYISEYAKILRPFGQICILEGPVPLDINPLKQKSLSVHWEFMFTKTMFNYQMESQGKILKKLAELIEAKKIISTANTYLTGFSAENIQSAHTLLESGKSIGKIVIDFL